MKGFCSFNNKQRKCNSYSEDYAVLFYIRLFNLGILIEYFRLALKKLKAQFVSFCIILYSFAFLLLAA